MAARKSLVEELAELVNPAPKSFEIEDLAFDTARVVEKDVDDEIEDFEEDIPSKLQIRAGSSLTQFKEDPRYAGKVISRKAMTGNVNLEEDDSNSEGDVYIKEHLEQVYGEGTDQSVSSSVSDGNQLSSGDEEVGSSGEDDPVPYNHSESDAEEGPSTPSEEEGPDTPSEESPLVITDRNLREEVEKGEAVKRQLRLWDGIVEGRIRLQKLLPLSNRLPQGVDMATFKDIGGTSFTQAVAQCETQLTVLLDELLNLKTQLLQDNEGIVDGRDQTSTTGATSLQGKNDDEEVDSDIAEGIDSDHDPGERDEDKGGGDSVNHKHSGKRAGRPWCLPKGKRRYEEYISELHQKCERYRDNTITKWSTKARLSSGKLSSKSFLQSDQSVLGQIKHVLGDKERLVKRTQLKRSNFQVFGKPTESSGGVSSNSDRHDIHLKSYDEEIFDDSDFYHQLLREVIEKKMNYTDMTDPVAMGRQWVALQKLRTKIKKEVDTRASKARKIRYDVHPKLVGFMAPREEGDGGFTDRSKSDLFSSLFGQSSQH